MAVVLFGFSFVEIQPAETTGTLRNSGVDDSHLAEQ